MPTIGDDPALPVVLGLGAALLAWYFAGNELMRRRARRLALWSKQAVDPLGGRQSVRWFTQQAFRLDVEGAEEPLRSVALTGLVESWDVPMIWLWNRLRGRRDMVLLQLTLRRPPPWGFEVYRPGSLLAGDARRLARQAGWTEEPVGELRLACAGAVPRKLAGELLAELERERSRLVRLAVRGQGPHLTLALDVPDPGGLEPRQLTDLARRLARAAAGGQ